MSKLFAKATLLIVSGPRNDPERKHLFVICTDPDPDDQQLIVSVCSVPENGDPYDSTCLLQKHEHPSFVRKPSYVFYARARLVSRKALLEGVRLMEIIPKDDMNGQVFLKVVNGICSSPQTPRKLKRYYETMRTRPVGRVKP